ncbi:MAG: pyruvate carboxylase subunit B [Desulfobacterales bacterium]|nr:pyruvate carboxylase subunit B [Desulfobacterales bacterium]MBS3755913.1 pyruvate carboxylase subunit B [Desulfobacterales bacterium]
MTEHHELKQTEIQYDKDRPAAPNPVKFEDLTLRDGHQSLFATRGRTEDMVPVAEMMDNIGFWAVEVWGGATFDTMHRFLNEDPWDRIRTLRRYFKKTPFSMLLRGQNLVGYRNYPDDVARVFVERAAENGMDIFRTFDALNDFRNFETVVDVIKKSGKHFQGCVCYSMTEPRMGGKVYNLDYFLEKAKELEEMGADTICIKDMAGLLSPYDAFPLFKTLKENISVPLHLHSHFTSGMAPLTHLKAIEAGVDIIDTCMSSYAYRTSHPAVEPMVMSLLGTNRDTGLDIEALAEINEKLEKDILPKYRHLLDDSKVSVIDINVLLHQTPGGMLSNLVNQLREMDALDRIDEVYEMLPKVRKDLGQVPLVTPTSQIVGIQTVNNVLFDDENESYKMITSQVKDLCFGLYGKTPAGVNPEVQKKALKGYPRGEKPIECRPAEILEPELEDAKEAVKDITTDIDDVLIYALYPVTGKKFLKYKYGLETPPESVQPKSLEAAKKEEELVRRVRNGELRDVLEQREKKAEPPEGENVHKFSVYVDGEQFEVAVEDPGMPYITGDPAAQPAPAAPAGPRRAAPAGASTGSPARPAPSAPKPGALAAKPESPKEAPKEEPKESASKPAADVEGHQIKAPMPGIVIRYEKKAGDTVDEGETVVVLEAMKMENSLPTPVAGTVKAINFSEGDSVAKNDVLCVIG